MSSAARTALVVVVVALLVVVGAIVWVAMREGEPEATPIPGPHQARVVVADPSIELPYLVEVPRTADGCPAATFRSPAEPGSVSDGFASIMLPGGGDGAVLAACIGAVDDLGPLEDHVASLWTGEAYDEEGEEDPWERLSIERVVSPLGDSLALTSRIGIRVLTDHYVERDGWIYAVGYLRPAASADADRAVVDAILASWEWR